MKLKVKKFKYICNLQKFAELFQKMALLVSINVQLLGENCHKISLIAGESHLLDEDIVHLFWNTFYTASLSM